MNGFVGVCSGSGQGDRIPVTRAESTLRSRGTYGSPRIYDDLKEQGETVGRHRVARLMREKGITARPLKRFCKTTDSNHNLPVAPNLLERNFNTDRPDTVWVGDITYIWTARGWTYLAVILDLFSRRVVGWALDDNMRSELVLKALEMAVGLRQVAPGLIFHSDRGSQYAKTTIGSEPYEDCPYHRRVSPVRPSVVATSEFFSANADDPPGLSFGLHLSVPGDSVWLLDDQGQVDRFCYGSASADCDLAAATDASLTRSPDLTGDFVSHDQATGSNGAAFSPGTRLDGSQF